MKTEEKAGVPVAYEARAFRSFYKTCSGFFSIKPVPPLSGSRMRITRRGYYSHQRVYYTLRHVSEPPDRATKLPLRFSLRVTCAFIHIGKIKKAGKIAHATRDTPEARIARRGESLHLPESFQFNTAKRPRKCNARAPPRLPAISVKNFPAVHGRIANVITYCEVHR